MSGRKKSLNDTQEFDLEAFDGNPAYTDDISYETIEGKPMVLDDAIVEFESGKQNFFVFNNARTEQLNVLYKHNNGKLGLIQPRG